MVGEAPRLTRMVRSLALALVTLPTASIAADGSDGDYRVTGQCRAGQAQGAYALRDLEGHLRAQGAFARGLRVGSFIFWSAEGVRLAHIPFDAGRIGGTLSLWHPGPANEVEPTRRLQASYRAGLREGPARSWYATGQPRTDSDYADDTLVAARGWSETGAILSGDEARRHAAHERADDDAEVESLLARVRRHMPDCAPPPPRQRADAARRAG